jgi:hypothetical protein
MRVDLIVRHFKLSLLFVAAMIATLVAASVLAIFVAWRLPTWENIKSVFDWEMARMFFGVWLFATLFTLPMSLDPKTPPSPALKDTE